MPDMRMRTAKQRRLPGMRMLLEALGENGWTRGQHALLRAVFGVCLALYFAAFGLAVFPSTGGAQAQLAGAAWASTLGDEAWYAGGPAHESVTAVLCVLAALLALVFAGGRFVRSAPGALWVLSLLLLGPQQLAVTPGLPFVSWALFACACLPAFGAGRAPGEPRPASPKSAEDTGETGGGIAPWWFAVVWLLLALGYGYGGFVMLREIGGQAPAAFLENSRGAAGGFGFSYWFSDALLYYASAAGALFQLCFPLTLCFAGLRPVAWSAMLVMQALWIFLLPGAFAAAGDGAIAQAGALLGMAALHAFAFNPLWVPAGGLDREGADWLFYDGHCGLCHGAVRFVLAEDHTGAAFVFAPLQSRTFESEVDAKARAALPDSVIVKTPDGKLLARSAAVLHVLERMGGCWRILARLARPFPRFFADALYDLAALLRRRLFTAPQEVCPVPPGPLRARFHL